MRHPPASYRAARFTAFIANALLCVSVAILGSALMMLARQVWGP